VGTPVIGGNMFFAIGSNESVPGYNPAGPVGGGSQAGLPLGWPVKLTQTILGSLFLGTGNLFVNPAIFPFTTAFAPPTGAPLGLFSGGTVAASLGDNGLALNIDPTVVQGYLAVNMGNGGPNHRQVLTMFGVTAGDLTATMHSADPGFVAVGQPPNYPGFGAGIGDLPDGNQNFGDYATFNHVLVTDTILGSSMLGTLVFFIPDFPGGTPPGMIFQDFGSAGGGGVDFVYLGVNPSGFPNPTGGSTGTPVAADFLTVAGQLSVVLSPGPTTVGAENFLEAHNTTTAFGFINGGGPNSLYLDDGGNVGYFVFNFIGH
jgi:hypothetical protein